MTTRSSGSRTRSPRSTRSCARSCIRPCSPRWPRTSGSDVSMPGSSRSARRTTTTPGRGGPGRRGDRGQGSLRGLARGDCADGPPARRGFPGGQAPDADVAELKGILEALHEALGAHAAGLRARGWGRTPSPPAPRARRATGGPRGQPYGSVGEVHPAIAEAWGIPGRPVMAALSLPQLLALVPDQLRAKPIPVRAAGGSRSCRDRRRDDFRSASCCGSCAWPPGPILADARLFDEYRGAQVGAGRVSYAIALRFQPEAAGDEKTVEKAMNRIRGSVRHHLGAEIR